MWTPKNETYLSRYVARFLREDLIGAGVVINREVEIRAGELTDILIDLPIQQLPNGDQRPHVRLVIETKGSWHPELLIPI